MGMWLTIRVDPELKAALRRMAKARRVQVSDLIRQLLVMELARLSYLGEEEKKAFGLEVTGPGRPRVDEEVPRGKGAVNRG